jgi:hypothetical protein
VQSGSNELKNLDLNLALVYAVDGKLDEAEQAATPYLTKEGLYNNMATYSNLSKHGDLAKIYLNMALTQSSTYYERAWNNLGALGDESGTSGIDTSKIDAVASPEGSKLPTGPEAGVKLNDIPESKPLHSDPASPYAGTVDKETGLALPSPVLTPAPPAVKPEPDVKADVKPEEKKKAKPEEKKGAKAKAKTEEKAKPKAKPQPKPKAPAKPKPKPQPKVKPVKKDESGDVPKVNPDVILLKKPSEVVAPTEEENDKPLDLPLPESGAGSSSTAPVAPPAETPAPTSTPTWNSDTKN